MKDKERKTMTHIEIFNRLANVNIAALWAIEDAVEKDLEASHAEYQAAIAEWEAASVKLNATDDGSYDYEYDLVFLNMQKAYTAYLEKHMVYSIFHGYYKGAKK